MPRPKSQIEKKLYAYYITPAIDEKLKAISILLNISKSQAIEFLVDTYYHHVTTGGELNSRGVNISLRK